MSKANGVFPGSPEESGFLLQIAQEMSARIGLSGLKAQRVLWVERAYKRKFVLPDRPIFRDDILLLSAKMRGKLAPEDWRAILCSSLIYDRTLHVKRGLGSLATYSGFVLVFPAAYLLSSIIFSPRNVSYSVSGAGVPFIALVIAGLALVGTLISPYMRHLMFLADQMTIQQFGLESQLLTSLKKIESMGLDDYPYRRGRIGYIPSVADRIRKLSKKGSY